MKKIQKGKPGYLNYKRKDEIRQLVTDKETVKIQYDQARKEKIDLEERNKRLSKIMYNIFKYM